MQPGHNSIFRFGVFEVDLANRELRKRGVRVHLQDQPFRVLEALLERPGELVAREELKDRLWAKDEFVEFDLAINAAIRKIRRALNDSPGEPQFIETIPKHGYRFVHALQSDPARPHPGRETAGATLGSLPPGSESGSPDGDSPIAPRSSARSPYSRWVTALVALMAVGVLIVWFAATGSQQGVRPLRPMPLTAFPGLEIEPTLSREGRQVAFLWNGGNAGASFDVFVKPVTSATEPLRLTETPQSEWGPTWSPDGNWIAYHRRDPEDIRRTRIVAISPTGGAERLLFRSAPEEVVLSSAWMADSASLVLALATDETRSRIVVLDPSGVRHDFTQPDSNAVGDRSPVVSPDGSKLAYLRRQIVGNDLWLGQPQEHTSRVWMTAKSAPLPDGWLIGPPGFPGRALAWYLDSNSVIATVGMDSQTELWQLHLNGRVATPLGLGTSVAQPTAASHADRIAYVRYERGENLWRFDFTDATVRPFAQSTRSELSPQISPDGRYVAFVSDRSGNYEIWVCATLRDTCRAITETRDGRPGSPRWAPDGRRIAYDVGFDETVRMYVVDADGGIPNHVDRPGSNTRPSWSRDGSWLVYSSVADGQREVWKTSVSSGRSEKVSAEPGINPFWSTVTNDVLFTRLDSEQLFSEQILWSVSADGRSAGGPVTDRRFHFDAWAQADDGWVYFPELNNAQELADILVFKRIEPSTGVEETVAQFELPTGFVGAISPFNSFDVAPSGEWAILAVREHLEADLMYVDGLKSP